MIIKSGSRSIYFSFSKVKMKKNYQVGEVKEIRGKRALVQIGLLPMNIDLNDLVAVEEK